MRLIDADEIDELFYKQVEYGATDLMDAFDDALQDCQTVDAVPVVRCKDCDNRIYIDMGAEIGVVGGCCIYKAALPEDFYCAYGKREVIE